MLTVSITAQPLLGRSSGTVTVSAWLDINRTALFWVISSGTVRGFQLYEASQWMYKRGHSYICTILAVICVTQGIYALCMQLT